MQDFVLIAVGAVVVLVWGWLGVRVFWKLSRPYKPNMKNPYGKSNLSLDRLHEVCSQDDPEPREGRTFAECHVVAGILETTSEKGVICRVKSYDRVAHIVRMMVMEVFPAHDMAMSSTLKNNAFTFHMSHGITKTVQFVTYETDYRKTGISCWPMVNFTEYEYHEPGYENYKPTGERFHGLKTYKRIE